MRYTLIACAAAFATAAAGEDTAAPPAGRGPAPPASDLAQRMIGELGLLGDPDFGYVDQMASDIMDQPREAAEADRREQDLETAFARDFSQERNAQAEISAITCRRSGCVLEFSMSPELSPQDRVRSLQELDQWLAWSQPCGYVLEPPPSGRNGTTRAVIDCKL